MNAQDALNIMRVTITHGYPDDLSDGDTDKLRDMADVFEGRGFIPPDMYRENYEAILALGDEGVALVVAYFMETA